MTWAQIIVKNVQPNAGMYPRPMLAASATKGINVIVSNEAPTIPINEDRSNAADQPGIPTILPISSPNPKTNKVRPNDHMAMTINFAPTIASRDVGNANISFAVRSENSRPKTQVVMMPKTTILPTDIPCETKSKNADHSVPVIIKWAFWLISPIERAAAGSFRMSMNKPPTRGAREKPSVVKSGSFERQAFSVSTHNEDKKLFNLILRLIA